MARRSVLPERSKPKWLDLKRVAGGGCLVVGLDGFNGRLEPARAPQPLTLGTVSVAAGAIDDAGVLAVVAPFDGAAHGCGAAVLDGPHQAPLMQGQGMRVPVGGAVLSKDVGQLQSWRGHAGPLRCGGLGLGSGLAAEALSGLQLIQRTLGLGDELRRDGGIAGGGVDAAVAEQYLNDPDVGAVLPQVRGEAIAQAVDGDAFAQAGAFGGI